MTDVAIVGGGLAGLSCALALQTAGVAATIFEASDTVGGRVCTDVVDGFRLDRGFQVMLTAYPEGQRLLNYEELEFCKFEPGALVWHGGKFHRFADPLRNPMGAAGMLLDSILPLGDKLAVAKLRLRVQQGSFEQMFARPEKTTRAYLQAVPFSDKIIDRFFEPFFGGVFLERELVTSSRFFEFLFRMFATGDTVVPAHGMQQIPFQLSAKLPPRALRTNARVETITRTSDWFTLRLATAETVEASAVVLAVPGAEGNSLLGGVGGWSVPEVRGWNRTTAFCYAAESVVVKEPIILLNGDGRAAGPVNNAAVMSAVSPQYAPLGAELVVASVVGEAPTEPVSMTRLDEAVRRHLATWFGPGVAAWTKLAAYPLEQALPLQLHAEWEQANVRLGGSRGVYVCGDHRETASIQGALASGRRAAEAIVQDWGIEAGGEPAA